MIKKIQSQIKSKVTQNVRQFQYLSPCSVFLYSKYSGRAVHVSCLPFSITHLLLPLLRFPRSSPKTSFVKVASEITDLVNTAREHLYVSTALGTVDHCLFLLYPVTTLIVFSAHSTDTPPVMDLFHEAASSDGWTFSSLPPLFPPFPFLLVFHSSVAPFFDTCTWHSWEGLECQVLMAGVVSLSPE